MRGPTTYVVAWGRKFSVSEGCILASALPYFSRSPGQGEEEYRHSNVSKHWRERGKTDTFSVWRADGKRLTKTELDALHWFYLGVMQAAGMLPTPDAIRPSGQLYLHEDKIAPELGESNSEE